MSSTMLIHGTRLAGTAPRIANNTYLVNASTPVDHALGWMSEYGRASGGLSRVMIMCHGIASAFTIPRRGFARRTSVSGWHSAGGPDPLENVSKARVLSGRVQQMIVYACGPARTRSGFRSTLADGGSFLQRARWPQRRSRVRRDGHAVLHDEPLSQLLPQPVWDRTPDYIDFGDWEGRVLRFTPDGHVLDRELPHRDGRSALRNVVRFSLVALALSTVSTGCERSVSAARKGRKEPVCATQDCGDRESPR